MDLQQSKRPKMDIENSNRSGEKSTISGIEYNVATVEQESELLNTLDDDCLREIFKYLPLIDLSNATEVCIRFNQRANEAFNSKYKHVLKIDNSFELNDKPKETEAVLRIFGPSIRSLSIVSTGNNGRTVASALKMINQQTTTALKELHLYRVDISKCSENLGPVLMKLETFKLNRCILRTDSEGFFGQTFPLLKQAQFKFYFGLNFSDLEKFIELNPKLKTLEIGELSWTDELANLIQLICDKLSNLVELEIEVFDKPTEQQLQKCALSFGKLGALKMLKFCCFGNVNATPLLKGLVKNEIQIEHLQLNLCEFDDNTIKSLSQLKQIKILELNSIVNLTELHIIELAKELPMLEKFKVQTFEYEKYLTINGLTEMVAHAKKLSHFHLFDASNIKIEINNYRVMLKAVQNRSEKNHLLIELSHGQIMVSDIVLSENQNWLTIKV